MKNALKCFHDCRITACSEYRYDYVMPQKAHSENYHDGHGQAPRNDIAMCLSLIFLLKTAQLKFFFDVLWFVSIVAHYSKI